MPSNKKRERLFIVVCVKVAVNRLLLLGKIKTLGLIFSHETAGLLASLLLEKFFRFYFNFQLHER